MLTASGAPSKWLVASSMLHLASRPMSTTSSASTITNTRGSAFDFDFANGVMTIRWNRTATPDESSQLMQRIEALWTQGQRYAVAMITHPEVNADARHRQIWGEWHERNRAQIDRHCAGMAITIDSAPIRALMTAISWFSRSEYAVKYVKSEAEAVAWARANASTH